MTAGLDLFGAPVPSPSKSSRKPTVARGYAGFPGKGPAGETCGSCQHIARAKRFRKCGLRRSSWTHGPGTDIKARTPACEKWEKAT